MRLKMFAQAEIEGAAREWGCSHTEALRRLMRGEYSQGAMDALAAHFFPSLISEHEH
jgi:hypothetical protein